MTLQVAVVGAGVVGLAAASELRRAGAEVRCYERDRPGGAQSTGSTRIFRHAHGDARLVTLAMRAGEKWRAWEQRSGRQLVGREGLLLTGDALVAAWSCAMAEAGAEHRLLPADEWQGRLPAACPPETVVLFDPAGGATRARRTIELLQEDLGPALQHDAVVRIEAGARDCRVHTENHRWSCDEVIIAAGLDTAALAAPLGLAVPQVALQHARFTFAVRDFFRDTALSCWIDEEGSIGLGHHAYAQPVGRTGCYAVGVGWDGERATLDVPADEVARRARAVAVDWVRRSLPGLDPAPVDEIRCVYPDFTFLHRGDGFGALRRDRVTAFYGNNLFKFAPLLGALLAESALSGALPPDLILPAVPELHDSSRVAHGELPDASKMDTPA